ncbi:MAG: alpha/beta fold hydrolase [Verrucomicrobiota bacterium]
MRARFLDARDSRKLPTRERLLLTPMEDEGDIAHQAPFWLTGGHLQTIVPALCRREQQVTGENERLELPDGDFLDLEWKRQGRKRLAILCHGLEANAGASYMQGMARILSDRGWDILAWNYRGCGAELNRLPRFYHSGATEDLDAVISHALEQHPADRLDLVGFSLGGNMVLKYLGERGEQVPSRVHRAIAFSVPCDLACSSRALDTPFNREVYMRRFIGSLVDKVRRKHAMFPEELDPRGIESIRTFREFDDRYTAPLHGFEDAEDYWRRCSSKPRLPGIRRPSLLINALNDPFLGPACFPRDEASQSAFLSLETPQDGGHLGFRCRRLGDDWMGIRAARFLEGESR